MLIHTTIHATEPERVARFLALLWGTEAMPVPELADAWIAFADTEGSGSVIVERALLPRPEARISLSTRLGDTAIHALAATEGWASRHASRFGDPGSAVGHAVVEVAVERWLVVDVLPEAMAVDRAAAMCPWRWAARLAGLVQPPRAPGPAGDAAGHRLPQAVQRAA